MTQFKVYYKKQSPREQLSPDSKFVDHALYNMIVDGEDEDNVRKSLSDKVNIKIILIQKDKK